MLRAKIKRLTAMKLELSVTKAELKVFHLEALIEDIKHEIMENVDQDTQSANP